MLHIIVIVIGVSLLFREYRRFEDRLHRSIANTRNTSCNGFVYGIDHEYKRRIHTPATPEQLRYSQHQRDIGNKNRRSNVNT